MVNMFKSVMGSRLFGTAGPLSDYDYKGVYIPSAKDILLGKSKIIDESTGNKNSKNSADDVDMVNFPLQHYLTLLTKMEANSLEMFFAPNDLDTQSWKNLKLFKDEFLSWNTKTFSGFGRSQANRYAVRGDRAETMEALVDLFESMDNNRKPVEYVTILNQMRDLKGVEIYDKPNPGGVMIPTLRAFGREVSLTVKSQEAAKIFRKPLESFGHRTKLAQEDAGIDWKGIYHAHRIVDEGIELFTTGELIFPCKNAPYYVQVRNKEVDFEDTITKFEENLYILENLKNPGFREKPDLQLVEELVIVVHQEAVRKDYK